MTRDQIRRGSDVSGGGPGGLDAAAAKSTRRVVEPSSRYTDAEMAADDEFWSAEAALRRAGTAPRRSQSGAGMEIDTSPDDAVRTTTVSAAGAG